MLINTRDYNIIQNDVPVLTRTDDGTYIDTNCYLSNLCIESESITDVLSCFEYKENFLTTIKQFRCSPKFVPVLRILTNSNIQTPDFYAPQDLLAVAVFLDSGKNTYTWLDYFEVNCNYRRNTAETQKYKTVGGSMLTSLQKEYWNQGIECRSSYAAKSFYFKYKFERMDNRELYLRWGPQR